MPKTYIMQKFKNLPHGRPFYLPDKSDEMNLKRASRFIKTDPVTLAGEIPSQMKVTKKVREKNMFNCIITESLHQMCNGWFAFIEDDQDVFEEGSS